MKYDDTECLNYFNGIPVPDIPCSKIQGIYSSCSSLKLMDVKQKHRNVNKNSRKCYLSFWDWKKIC